MALTSMRMSRKWGDAIMWCPLWTIYKRMEQYLRLRIQTCISTFQTPLFTNCTVLYDLLSKIVIRELIFIYDL